MVLPCPSCVFLNCSTATTNLGAQPHALDAPRPPEGQTVNSSQHHAAVITTPRTEGQRQDSDS
jgi:hypothetical protein